MIFTYAADPEDAGHGEIWWNGVEPPPPPPPVHMTCGSCGASLMKETTFADDDVSQKAAVPSALCTADSQCIQWAWHENSQGRFAANECHLHGKMATARRKGGVVSGVMNRTGTAA